MLRLDGWWTYVFFSFWQTIQQAMTAAITNEEGGGIDEQDAMEFMDRLVRKEDRFHTECF